MAFAVQDPAQAAAREINFYISKGDPVHAL